MPLGTLDKGLGCSPTSESESDLGTRPRSNYVEKKTKAGRTHIGF
ncbi:mCG148175 [Mus musculus]|nr:mCG148175 [Mus musculus]